LPSLDSLLLLVSPSCSYCFRSSSPSSLRLPIERLREAAISQQIISYSLQEMMIMLTISLIVGNRTQEENDPMGHEFMEWRNEGNKKYRGFKRILRWKNCCRRNRNSWREGRRS
jgi:hypothetical protein